MGKKNGRAQHRKKKHLDVPPSSSNKNVEDESEKSEKSSERMQHWKKKR